MINCVCMLQIQLTLFLKEIGMPVHEAVQFWKHYYSQACADTGGCCHTWEGNARRYQYSIRHLYGLEGSHIDYTAHRCLSLQVSIQHLYGLIILTAEPTTVYLSRSVIIASLAVLHLSERCNHQLNSTHLSAFL
jgi:DNA primase large subunit